MALKALFVLYFVSCTSLVHGARKVPKKAAFDVPDGAREEEAEQPLAQAGVKKETGQSFAQSGVALLERLQTGSVQEVGPVGPYCLAAQKEAVTICEECREALKGGGLLTSESSKECFLKCTEGALCGVLEKMEEGDAIGIFEKQLGNEEQIIFIFHDLFEKLQIAANLPEEGAKAILKPLFYLIWEEAGQQSFGTCNAYANKMACIMDTVQRAVDALLAMNVGEKNINFLKEMWPKLDASEDLNLEGIKMIIRNTQKEPAIVQEQERIDLLFSLVEAVLGYEPAGVGQSLVQVGAMKESGQSFAQATLALLKRFQTDVVMANDLDTAAPGYSAPYCVSATQNVLTVCEECRAKLKSGESLESESVQECVIKCTSGSFCRTIELLMMSSIPPVGGLKRTGLDAFSDPLSRYALDGFKFATNLPESTIANLKPLFYMVWAAFGQRSFGQCDNNVVNGKCIADYAVKAFDAMLKMNVGEKNFDFVYQLFNLDDITRDPNVLPSSIDNGFLSFVNNPAINDEEKKKIDHWFTVAEAALGYDGF